MILQVRNPWVILVVSWTELNPYFSMGLWHKSPTNHRGLGPCFFIHGLRVGGFCAHDMWLPTVFVPWWYGVFHGWFFLGLRAFFLFQNRKKKRGNPKRKGVFVESPKKKDAQNVKFQSLVFFVAHVLSSWKAQTWKNRREWSFYMLVAVSLSDFWKTTPIWYCNSSNMACFTITYTNTGWLTSPWKPQPTYRKPSQKTE